METFGKKCTLSHQNLGIMRVLRVSNIFVDWKSDLHSEKASLVKERDTTQTHHCPAL